MIVAFDIDDTLYKIEYENGKAVRQVPDHDLIPVLRWFAQNGDTVWVWSAGGMDYAQTIVDKLGLTSLVTVMNKQRKPWDSTPDITFDDMEVKLGKANVKIKREIYSYEEQSETGN